MLKATDRSAFLLVPEYLFAFLLDKSEMGKAPPRNQQYREVEYDMQTAPNSC